MKEKVSIIIPVYNVENIIERCMDSVIRQTHYNIEVIAVDDGSTDHSGNIIDSYALNDSRIKVYHIKNGGISNARNYGMEKATGDFISFVDSDDLVAPNYIERLLAVLKSKNVSAVTCKAIDVQENKVETDWAISKAVPMMLAINPDIAKKEKLFDYTKQYAHVVIWGGIFTKEILQGLKFSTELYVGEDTLFFAKVLSRAQKIAHIDEPLYCYVLRKESASHGNLNEKKWSEIVAWKLICENFGEENIRFQLSCKTAYAMRCKLFYQKMVFQGLKRDDWHHYLMTELRNNIVATLCSNLKLKDKIQIALAAIYPNGYFYVFRTIKKIHDAFKYNNT